MGLRFIYALLIGTLTTGVASALGIHLICARLAPPPVKIIALAQETAEEIQADEARIPRVTMTDITQSAGIRFLHENGAIGEKLLPESMGGGVAFFDYDNDLDADLLLVNSGNWPGQKVSSASQPRCALYRNEGGGKFSDVSVESGLDVSLFGMGVAVGDYDGDGWSDVFFSALGPDRLFRNVQGRFVETTAIAGVAGGNEAWGTSCCWLDYNRDGQLDLFVCNYLEWSRELDLSRTYQLSNGKRAYRPPQSFQGAQSYLYRNEGGGRFQDVSATAGIEVVNRDDPGRPQPVGKALGVSSFDFDGDGWQDLVVASDEARNFLFHNLGNGAFEEIAEQAGIAYDYAGGVNGGMGIDVARWRNAKRSAVAIGTFVNEAATFHCSDDSGLFFRDESLQVGLASPTRPNSQFAMVFFDYDLDGRLDLFAANGHVESDIDEVSTVYRFRQFPNLFWNAGSACRKELVLVPIDKVGESFAAPLAGRGAAYADIDGDGDLDLVITQVAGSPRLLRNDQALGHHWLRVKVLGRGADREALGAVVRLHHGTTTQERQVCATRGYLSQSELTVTFGLGEVESVDRLEVTWPDGTTVTLQKPPLDQLLIISPESYSTNPSDSTNQSHLDRATSDSGRLKGAVGAADRNFDE